MKQIYVRFEDRSNNGDLFFATRDIGPFDNVRLRGHVLSAIFEGDTYELARMDSQDNWRRAGYAFTNVEIIFTDTPSTDAV